MSKPSRNEQPDKFFEEARTCLATLQGIPVIAIDRLRTDELSRDVLISIINQCFDIAHEASINIVEEMEKQELRNNAQANLKELLKDDRLITLEELKKNGLKVEITDKGPIVVPA